MVREVLFRGKRKTGGEWVDGPGINTQYDVNGREHVYIGVLLASERYPSMQNIEWHEVIPETVGQYIGLVDKNGKKIFEGDILYCTATVLEEGELKEKERYEGVVKYGAFNCSCCDGVYGWYIEDGDIRLLNEQDDFDTLYVLGNIHDNPELLEVNNGTVC